jgi:hypothetical protein
MRQLAVLSMDSVPKFMQYASKMPSVTKSWYELGLSLVEFS